MLEMAENVCINNKRAIEDQILLFQIRTEINPLPANTANPKPCFLNCQEILNSKHFFDVQPYINVKKIRFEELINGNINQIKDGLIIWTKQ